jgi:tetratricopeptide (TPR) repeat protein
MAQAALGDYYTAVETMNYAKKLDPNSAFVPAYRGYIEYLFRYYDDAEASFHNAIDIGGEGSGIAIQGIELVEKAKNQASPLINTAASTPDLQIPESRDGTISPQTNSRMKNSPPPQNFNAIQAPSSMEGSDGVMAPSVNQH